tara:strand:+ start:1616 stop:2182 length:567 start_codon:yes stop_codon:yes gene_type:complete
MVVKGVDIKGLDSFERGLRKFNFRIPNIKSRFLDQIGNDALTMLQANTPIDTGNLRDSWQMIKTPNEVIIANDQQDLLSLLLFGSIHHPMPRNFVMEVNNQVNNMVMQRLEQALAESHRWFAKLPGGKNRKHQQVGRTSAGFKGGTSFAGRSSLVRAGTGRRQLKRRLSLRRRRGKSINQTRKDVQLG